MPTLVFFLILAANGSGEETTLELHGGQRLMLDVMRFAPKGETEPLEEAWVIKGPSWAKLEKAPRRHEQTEKRFVLHALVPLRSAEEGEEERHELSLMLRYANGESEAVQITLELCGAYSGCIASGESLNRLDSVRYSAHDEDIRVGAKNALALLMKKVLLDVDLKLVWDAGEEELWRFQAYEGKPRNLEKKLEFREWQLVELEPADGGGRHRAVTHALSTWDDKKNKGLIVLNMSFARKLFFAGQERAGRTIHNGFGQSDSPMKYFDTEMGQRAVKTVLVHEYAHQIQFRTLHSQPVLRNGNSKKPQYRLVPGGSVRDMELEADALAGFIVERFFEVGPDDAKVLYTLGDSTFDNWHHGLPEERMAAFKGGAKLSKGMVGTSLSIGLSAVHDKFYGANFLADGGGAVRGAGEAASLILADIAALQRGLGSEGLVYTQAYEQVFRRLLDLDQEYDTSVFSLVRAGPGGDEFDAEELFHELSVARGLWRFSADPEDKQAIEARLAAVREELSVVE